MSCDCFTAYALQLSFDKTKCVSLWNEKKIIQRETLNEDDVYDKDRGSLWRVLESYPLELKCEVMELDMEQQQKISYARGLKHSQVSLFRNKPALHTCTLVELVDVTLKELLASFVLYLELFALITRKKNTF